MAQGAHVLRHGPRSLEPTLVVLSRSPQAAVAHVQKAGGHAHGQVGVIRLCAAGAGAVRRRTAACQGSGGAWHMAQPGQDVGDPQPTETATLSSGREYFMLCTTSQDPTSYIFTIRSRPAERSRLPLLSKQMSVVAWPRGRGGEVKGAWALVWASTRKARVLF